MIIEFAARLGSEALNVLRLRAGVTGEVELLMVFVSVMILVNEGLLSDPFGIFRSCACQSRSKSGFIGIEPKPVVQQKEREGRCKKISEIRQLPKRIVKESII